MQATLRHQGLRRHRLTARHIVHAALSLPQTTDIQKLNDEDRTELAHRLGYRQIGKELPDDVTLGQIIKSMPQEVRMAFMRTAKHLDRAQSCTGHVSVSSIGCCLAKAAAWPGTLLQSHWLFIRCWGQAVPRPFKGLQLVLQCSSQCTAVTTCQPQPPEHGAVLSTPHAKLTQAYAMFHPALQVFEVKPLKAWSAVGITLASVAVSLYLISISPWYMLPLAWAFAGTAFTGVSCQTIGCSPGDRPKLPACWDTCALGPCCPLPGMILACP